MNSRLYIGLNRHLIVILTMLFSLSLLLSCGDDDGEDPIDPDGSDLTGVSESYTMFPIGDNGRSGTLTFEELEGGGTLVTISLSGTSAGDLHPAHIHSGTAVDGGPIVIHLEPVDGTSGQSVSTITENADGANVTYNQLVNLFDGHVNVHLSSTQLEIFISQTDIGANVLTGVNTSYEILTPNTTDVVGSINMEQRLNGQTLISLEMSGDLSTSSFSASIDQNSAAEDGVIVVALADIIDGSSLTNVTSLEDGTAIQYNDLISYDGHVTIKDSSGQIFGLGDIGGNELTSESITYNLIPSPGQDISGQVEIIERQNGTSLVQVTATGLSSTSTYDLNLISETAAEGGEVLSQLNNLSGEIGTVQSTIRSSDAGDRLDFDDLLALDGHIRLTSEQGNKLAAADIGENELTGESQEAIVEQNGGSGITGLVTFFKRKSGFSLVVVEVQGTSTGALHPIHIHDNSAIERGPIAVDLTHVDGALGFSETTVIQSNQGDEITYEELIDYDGYVAIHESDQNLANIISLSDIGQNTLTGRTKSYSLDAVNESGISGLLTFRERKNLTTLVDIAMDGTTAGVTYPFNIHNENIIDGGVVTITLSSVDGTTGVGFSNIRETNGAQAITYDELLVAEFHVNLYEETAQLVNLRAQGDIGGNELTGNSVSFTLDEQNDSGITGQVTFKERASGFTVVLMELTGSNISNVHPNHIHINSFEMGGGVIVTFTNIVGSPGSVFNHVEALDDGTPLTYEEILVMDAHVIAHVSPGDLTYVAAGNIGINGTPTNGRKLSYAPNRKSGYQKLDYAVIKCGDQ
ncbi:MAG: CHRD domain-containing protein [Bacteroidota bacterium]